MCFIHVHVGLNSATKRLRQGNDRHRSTAMRVLLFFAVLLVFVHALLVPAFLRVSFVAIFAFLSAL